MEDTESDDSVSSTDDKDDGDDGDSDDDDESSSESDDDEERALVKTPLMPKKCSSSLSDMQASDVPCSAPPHAETNGSTGDSGGVARKKLMTKILCVDKTRVKKRKTTDENFDEVTFAGLMRPGKVCDVLFHKEIRQRAKKAGIMNPMSNETLEKYVLKIFGLHAFKPSKTVNGKRKQASGFKNVRFARVCRKLEAVPVKKALQITEKESMAGSFSSVLLSNPVGAVSDKMSAIQPQAILLQRMVHKKKGVVYASWQQGVMSSIKASLGALTLSCEREEKHVKVEANVGVGVVLSKDRQGCHVVNAVVPGSSAALNGVVQIGESITSVCDIIVHHKTTEELRTMLMGTDGTNVAFTVAPSLRTVTLQRSFLVMEDVVAAPLDKIFFYGGSHEDRDKCICRILSEHETYFIDDPTQNNLLKIAEVYSKSMLPKSLVVVKYEETFAATESKMTTTTTAANEKTHKEAYAVTRCLLKGYFWDENRGHVVFDAPTRMFVFCNEQPYHRAEWEGWTFYNVTDREA